MKRHVVDTRSGFVGDVDMTPKEEVEMEADRARPRPEPRKKSETEPLARLLVQKGVLTAEEVDAN